MFAFFCEISPKGTCAFCEPCYLSVHERISLRHHDPRRLERLPNLAARACSYDRGRTRPRRGKDRTIDIQSQTITLLEQEKEKLQLAFNQLLQRAFGNRSERYIDNPDQLRLDFGDTRRSGRRGAGPGRRGGRLQQTIPEHQRRKPAEETGRKPARPLAALRSDRHSPRRNEDLPANMASGRCCPNRCGTRPKRWNSSGRSCESA